MGSKQVPQEERVVLVDEMDRCIGSGEKLAVHRTRQLHRAFSIFLVEPSGRLLLQRRASGKYHSGGLWSNTCCGHPRPGEPIEAAARRRLDEELGMHASLGAAFLYRYDEEVGPGLYENEIVHVFFGRSAEAPRADPREVMEVGAFSLEALEEMAAERPDQLTIWLRHYLRDQGASIRKAIGGAA